MCACHFAVYFLSFCMALVLIAKPMETMDVLNSFPLVLSCLKELGTDLPTQYDEPPFAMKLIFLLGLTQGTALSAAMISLAFSTLPTCYFPTAERLGLIPDKVLPPFAWQLIFFPLEYATYLPPMLSAPFAGSTLFIVIEVCRLYLHNLR